MRYLFLLDIKNIKVICFVYGKMIHSMIEL